MPWDAPAEPERLVKNGDTILVCCDNCDLSFGHYYDYGENLGMPASQGPGDRNLRFDPDDKDKTVRYRKMYLHEQICRGDPDVD